MKNLIFDFICRWWWMLLITPVLSMGSGYYRSPVLLTPFALVCLQFDIQRGFLRAVRTLPVSKKKQSIALWIATVPLIPVLSIIPFILGSLASPSKVPLLEAHLPFACAVQFWTGLGVCGLGFLLFRFLLSRRPISPKEMLQQTFSGSLWGLSFLGCIYLSEYLPKSPLQVLHWHYALFASVPFFTLGSFLSAQNIINRRLLTEKGLAPVSPNNAAPTVPARGLGGLPLLVTTITSRIVGISLLMTLIQRGIVYWESGNLPTDDVSAIPDNLLLVTMGTVLCATAADLFDLRSLRILPLRTGTLASVVALIPIGMGVISSFFMNHSTSILALPNAAALTSGAIVIGFGMFIMAASFQLTGGWNLAARILAGALSPSLMIYGLTPTFLIAIAFPLGVIGYFWLYYGLKSSTSFYCSRHVFGFAPDNPMSA